MAQKIRRKNESLLLWARFVYVTAFTYAGLAGMAFRPGWGAAALALATGGLTLLALDLGLLAMLVALSLPVTAANPVLGIVFVVLGVVGIRYLGADGGRVFVVVTLAIAGAFAGPVWAAAAIAGLVMGAGEGALAAALACISVEAVGIVLGRATLFGTISGGSDATLLLDFGANSVPATLFAGQWLKDAFGGFGSDTVNGVISAIGATTNVLALALQPVLWAAGAAVAGILARVSRERARPVFAVAGAVAGAVIPGVSAVALFPAFGVGTPVSSVAAAAASSAVLAALAAWIWERVFPLEVLVEATPGRAASMAAEDADVDELLRLISTAEERLASEHTTEKVVMITDMKSFSKMTEEDGSMLTAKAIQKHRDLLLPVIERHGGRGKSTGGDGLIAAFDDAKGAVTAAAEMQQTLAAHNSAHPNEREMTVRIGVADGEVVLDKGGRPFIGNALNLAARVMNLADGGQAFVTAAVSQKAGGIVPTASLGDFELKNIGKPVTVVEILWAPGQEPGDPRTREQ